MTDGATVPILAFAKSLYAALDDDDIEPFVQLCAEDVIVRYPPVELLPYGGTWLGRDGVRRFLEAHEAAEEILSFDAERMVAVDDSVFVTGTFEGRARASGVTWSTVFVHILTVESGRLTRWEAYFDTAAAVRARRAEPDAL